MTLHDLVDLSIGSLWRIKLRAFLTIAGVVIAIATFVAMLSFAAGNQKWVARGYSELGLLTRINVTPKNARGPSHAPEEGEHEAGSAATGAKADTTKAAVLDQKAVRALAKIPGVQLAYPFVEFDVSATLAKTSNTPGLPDTHFTTKARALSLEAMKLKPYSTFLGGAVFSSEDAREAVVTSEFLKQIGIDRGDALIGQKLILSTRVASTDSAMAGVIGTPMVEGAVIGIVLGWAGTRIVALVMEAVMRREDMPVFDPFAMPVWLIALALAFGIAVSVAAGAYPARRAARVDPVEALRGE